MPATSKAQFRFFQWIKHNPGAAKRKGISKRVAEEFTASSPKGLPERKSKKQGHGIAKIMGEKK